MFFQGSSKKKKKKKNTKKTKKKKKHTKGTVAEGNMTRDVTGNMKYTMNIYINIYISNDE